MAYVAAGRFDGYFQENLCLWDIAAGIILINEAGGNINSFDLTKKKKLKFWLPARVLMKKCLKSLISFNCFIIFICYKSRYEKRYSPKLSQN